MTDDTRCYLGDGVYVELERDMIKLTTSDGIFLTNAIYLEREVLESFGRWMHKYLGFTLDTDVKI